MSRHLRLAIVFIVTAVCGLALSHEASAQVPRYQSPSGPTLSPYLNYFRNDVGAVNNYYNLVRPQIQLRDTLRQHSAAIQSDQTQLQGLRRIVTEQTQAAPTGIGAGYMNYSHYYPSLSNPAAMRRPGR